MTASTITFEYPINEHVRKYLRIENLFNRFEQAVYAESFNEHHLALHTLFEIMECASRIDLKLNILQDLEQQKKCAYEESILAELSECATALQNSRQKFGQHLRDNEWLMNVKQHMAIVGSVNPVDLPSYYYWADLPAEERQQQLRTWAENLMPTGNSIQLLLKLLRQNAQETECVAEKGVYTDSGIGKQKVELIQVETDFANQVMPEISVNKYMMCIRFVGIDFQHIRGPQSVCDIAFRLRKCCVQEP